MGKRRSRRGMIVYYGSKGMNFTGSIKLHGIKYKVEHKVERNVEARKKKGKQTN